MAEQKDKWEELRKPFPNDSVGLLPKVNCYGCTQATKNARSAFDKHCDKHKMTKCNDCGAYITEGHIHLDYVGHANVTDRLNTVVGPENWSLEPMAVDDRGNPVTNNSGELWCWLTILGARKMCVGDGANSSKELIGDALRNGAMRFGVALDLWTKEELESALGDPDLKNDKPTEKVADTKQAPTKVELENEETTKATDEQLNTVRELGKKLGYGEGALKATVTAIKTSAQASAYIAKFQERIVAKKNKSSETDAERAVTAN